MDREIFVLYVYRLVTLITLPDKWNISKGLKYNLDGQNDRQWRIMGNQENR